MSVIIPPLNGLLKRKNNGKGKKDEFKSVSDKQKLRKFTIWDLTGRDTEGTLQGESRSKHR